MILIAQIVTQTIQNQSLSSYLVFVINLFFTSIVVSITFIAFRFEKLSNIFKYESDKKHLNAWKQNLIQRMNVNHDRYFIDRVKIVYAKSRLIIKKKAHNLMNQYRVNKLCVLTNFDEWRRNLRHCCENFFEVEDARTYLREILKQDSLSFAEYYNLFYQKKKRSLTKNASLINCIKRNVNYFTRNEYSDILRDFWIDIYIIKPLEKAEEYHWRWDSWFILIVAIKWAWSTRRRRVIEALTRRSRYENKEIRAQLIKRSKEWENSTSRRRGTRLKRCRERKWKHW